jgi:hypothetical protein
MAGDEMFVIGAKGLGSIRKLQDPTIIEQLL